MFRYMLIPFVLFFSPPRFLHAQELHAVANRFSQEMSSLGLAIGVGAIAIVSIGMMLGKKDAGVMTTQTFLGIGLIAVSGALISFIQNIAG